MESDRLTPEERQRAINLIEGLEQERGIIPQKRRVVYENGRFREAQKPPELTPVSAAELMTMNLPPLVYLVDKILPLGLCMLGAPSKYYKSYMALDMCLCICEGRPFLGFETTKSGCLYLDLESTKRRPQSRIRQILGGKPAPDNLEILTAEDEVRLIGDGFEEQIAKKLEENPDIRLVVVDVFQRIRPAMKKSQTGYDRDYDDLGPLKKLADSHNICLLLIHHTRKMKDPNDVFNELSGSMGVMGALDAAWVISKSDRFLSEGTLSITGRDMESQQFKIEFEKDKFRWRNLGTAADIETQRLRFEFDQSPVVQTIKKLIAQGGGHWEGSASDIQKASKYFNCPIYDDVSQIGKLINRYDVYWWTDGIEMGFARSNKKKIYKFTVTPVTSDTTDISVTPVTGG